MTRKNVRKWFMFILIASFLVLLPLNLALPQESLDRALVLAVGVDKADEKYEVSIQIMSPQSNQSGYTEKRTVQSDKGKSVDDAIAQLQLKVGKKLAVAHTTLLLISESAIGENIVDILDIFLRSRDFGTYILVVTTPNSAKEVLDLATQDDAGADTLVNLISFNNENVYGRQTTLHDVLNGYYSPTKTSLLSRITLAPTSQGSQGGGSQGSDGGQGGQSESGGSGGGASSGGGDKELDNNATVAILRNGKLVKVLEQSEYMGFHWLMPTKNTAGVVLDNVNDDKLKNAKITLEIVDAKDNIKCEMTGDNRPIVKFKTQLKYRITSSVQDEYSPLSYAEFSKDSAKVIKPKLQKLVDTQIQSALNTSKELQVDVWNLYDKFHQKFGKRFTKYMELNEGDYLKDLEIYVEVEVEEIKF